MWREVNELFACSSLCSRMRELRVRWFKEFFGNQNQLLEEIQGDLDQLGTLNDSNIISMADLKLQLEECTRNVESLQLRKIPLKLEIVG